MVSTSPLPRALETPAKTSRVLLFEGPDKSGKSTIAKAYAKQYGLPYYKNPRERQQKLDGEIGLVTKYCGVWFADFLQQVPVSVILDRHYPSEWVYSQVEGRSRDEALLREIDDLFANAGVKIIICLKNSYEGLIDETTPSQMLPQIAETYRKFPYWSRVRPILLLDTTDEDIQSQLKTIHAFEKVE